MKAITAEDFRNYLVIHLFQSCGMNQTQVSAIVGMFDKLTPIKGAESAFRTILAEYGSADENKAVQEVALASTQMREYIERHLKARLNEAGIKIETNPIQRVRAAIERLHKNLAKCSGIESPKGASYEISDEELADVKSVSNSLYTALASRLERHTDKRHNLSVLVRYDRRK
jgi:hypothetical protein